MSLWGDLGPRAWVWRAELVRNGPESARLIAISNLCRYWVWSSRLGMGWSWGAFKIWMVYNFILLFFWYFINLSEKYKLTIFPFENQWKCGPIDFFLIDCWRNGWISSICLPGTIEMKKFGTTSAKIKIWV